MLKRLLSTVLLISATSLAALAQTGQGELKGKIIDAETGEPVPFVNVVVELNGVLQAGAASDFDGVYFIKPITPGTYTVKASAMGMSTVQVTGVGIRSGKTQFLDIKMSTNAELLDEVQIVEYKVPVFEKDQTVVSTTITKDDLVRMPARSASAIAATAGGVYSSDDGTGDLNIRGARSDANYVFIDGIKVRGSNNLPQSAVEEISVITGGLPAQYGDITGGVISITTRGPSANYFGSLEYVTSGYKFGDDIYGLDSYGYNLLEASVSGPLLMKKDSTGKKTKPIVGFFLSGNFTSIIDERPAATGTWRVKDETLDQLKANPLRIGTGSQTGTFQNAEFLRMNSFEKVATRENVARNGFVVSGKLDFATGKNTNLTFGGSLDWNRRNQFQYDYSLYNYENNPLVTESTWRVFGRFTQRLGGGNTSVSDEQSASTIKNAFYSVQVDYNEDNFRRESEEHKDNFFAYGHYGEFTRYQERDYGDGVTFDTIFNELGPVYIGPARVQESFSDTLIGFRPSSLNPEAAQFTSDYYEFFGWQGYDENGNPVFDSDQASLDADGNGIISDDERNFYLRRFENIRSNGGLINGDLGIPGNSRQIYNIWDNHARVWDSYQENSTSQFRITAMGSADIKNHAISVGFEYEQRVDRGYSVSPSRLWNIGNQLANSHIQNLDTRNPTIDFTQTIPTVSYERLNSSPGDYLGNANNDETQSFLDYNIRRAQGLNPDGTDFIDFHALKPEELKIDYFSTDELLNNGSELVYYYGYDAYGNEVTDNPSIDDFFNARDENNNFTRPIGAFRPTYVAGYIQDKFTFDDLVFNIGLRVDRYDANQSVLKDKYVLFPTVKAGESEARQLAQEMADYSIPGNIGSDYVVYVDNVESPSRIVGFRDEDTWFNAEGIEIEDAGILEGANGIAPLLVDKENTESQDITSASFEDYTPQVNFMPRISFSFPISDEATFFAHYDVLTRRPTAGGDLFNYTRLNPLDYYFIQQRTAQDRVANPDLKPERTIDYSVGFKQKITNSSSISIEAFYRELRDQIQIIGVQQAYPSTYTTFDNIDFGTVKGLTFSYDMRRTGNLSMRASYTLQFAEGTGSSTESALNLVRAGLQNLRTTTPLSYDQRHTIVATVDYRYGDGKNYNGPVLFDKQILKNTGANFQFNLGSGTPYSQQIQATGTRLNAGGGTALLDGTINGSRLPWQFRVDMRIDRDIPIKVGKDKKPLTLNVYLQMLNVLNALNPVAVYRATGTSDDDGYLTEPVFANSINTQNDPQAFRELYTMNMQDYRFFSLPRRTRIGFILNF